MIERSSGIKGGDAITRVAARVGLESPTGWAFAPAPTALSSATTIEAVTLLSGPWPDSKVPVRECRTASCLVAESDKPVRVLAASVPIGAFRAGVVFLQIASLLTNHYQHS